MLLNKLQLIHLDNPEQHIKIRTISREQYTATLALHGSIEDVSVEEDLEDRTIQGFRKGCVVFDDMLDSNQKLIDPFFTRGRHNDLNVYCLTQLNFDFAKITIRNKSTLIT